MNVAVKVLSLFLRRRVRTLFVALVVLQLLTLLLLLFNRSADFTSRYEFIDDLSSSDRSSDERKVILLWTSYYGQDDFHFGFGHRPFVDNQCPVSDCFITNNRSLLPLASAVVFHIRDLNPNDIPHVRFASQRWVFYLFEAPTHTVIYLRPLNNFFNWTFTHRMDSDVPPVYTFLNRSSVSSDVLSGLTSKKKKLAAWLVSHCWTFSRRETYVEQLRKYMPVDVMGDCGDLQLTSCSKQDSNVEQCFSHLAEEYKFYLSFENSVCRDYVTEKFFNALQHAIVPVVFGGANYSLIAPPHSYIDVLAFPSPRHLAEHLLRLDADDRAYADLLEWKRHHTLGPLTTPWCHFCAKLHDADQPPKVYDDIVRWWHAEGGCRGPLTLPHMGTWTVSQYFGTLVDVVWTEIRDAVLNRINRQQ